MTFYPPPRFPSQSSQRDRSRPSSSDSGLIIGLYRTRRKARNGSRKSSPGAGENRPGQLCGRNRIDLVWIYPEVATKHRKDATRVSDDIIEHDRQKLFVGKNALPSLYAGQIVSAASRPGGFEVIEEPQVGRFVDRHFRPLKSHQRRRPCSRYRIAQGI